MYYHVAISRFENGPWQYNEWPITFLDMEENEVQSIIVEPYLKGQGIEFKNRHINYHEIRKISISKSNTPSTDKTNHDSFKKKGGSFYIYGIGYAPFDYWFYSECEEVTEQFIENEKANIQRNKRFIEWKIINNIMNKKIFIVHGHNEEMKISVARTLESLNLTPIILHEQPNKGKTIIEKFSEYSDVEFAIVLLSPDDIGYSTKGSSKNEKFRARQNVIFELGFFIGKLGREKVFCLILDSENFEMPTDYSGIIYNIYDSNGFWKFNLARELNELGYKVDANRLL